MTPAVLADERMRELIVVFFRSLPLALERGDLRVVHACWDDAMIEAARRSTDSVTLHDAFARQIEANHALRPELDKIDQGLEHQNRNPAKVLTSGEERRVQIPFEASGKTRYEERVPWWEDYDSKQPTCVFGHYSLPEGTASVSPNAICIDYGVAKRWQERKAPGFDGNHKLRLAAIRFPERIVLCDDGSSETLSGKR